MQSRQLLPFFNFSRTTSLSFNRNYANASNRNQTNIQTKLKLHDINQYYYHYPKLKSTQTNLSCQSFKFQVESNRLDHQNQMPIATQNSFYQRQLPKSCVSFTSDDGKKLFKTALAAGHMESFFPLASQLVTQHEPSFCGLATLCTVLNALGVDPKRIWKHPWRWFEQDMLDCCRPLDSIRKIGITLAEFNCLARCNGLELTTRSPPPANSTLNASEESIDETKIQSLKEFRSNVALVTKSSSQFMVVSFSRASLGQTGSGHFSPLAGFSPSDDRVLLLDVARFKYPSYWVPLEDLYNSMVPIDPASGTPRGYSILSYSPLIINQANCKNCNPPTAPSITRINLNKSSWSTLSKKLNPILNSLESEPITLSTAVRTIYNHLAVNVDVISNPPIEIRPDLEEAEEQKTQTIEHFKHISDLMDSLGLEQDPSLSDLNHQPQLIFLFSLAILPHRQFPVDLVIESIDPELAYLRAQLDALGECCSIENHPDVPPNHVCLCKKEQSN